MTERPQYYENDLTPLPINQNTLPQYLEELRAAVRNGAEIVHSKDPLPEQWGAGGMMKHFHGIALAFFRLDYQAPLLDGAQSPNYRQYALDRIPPGFPETPLIPSRLSTCSLSPLGAVILRILASVAKTNWGKDSKPSIAKEDIATLEQVTQLALQNGPLVPHNGRNMGETSFWLLWALLNIRAHEYDDETRLSLAPVLGQIPKLLDAIIDAGRQGSQTYIENNGEDSAHPLMYAWMEGHYAFGAVPVAGILPILLSCKPEELAPHISIIGETVTALSKLSVSSNGHLPMTSPPYGDTKRPSELVQLCHGSPGILILLSTALKNTTLVRDYWCPEWDQAIYLATQRVWEEGLLSKGGSLCHGVAGNGWPWLLLHNSFAYHAVEIDDARRAYQQKNPAAADDRLSQKLTPDYFLSRGLTFLLHARQTKPYNSDPGPSDKDYRMPDDPYSLYEGLAGNLCAWAEACARLRKDAVCGSCLDCSGLDQDAGFQDAMRRQLGFPLIGGNGALGTL
ncbi:hypothetical protein N7468_003939 [Penicillium chermesinum]|uniref:Uncharacterized protein n=1 Tax=Penicillium chermesinum TaxID=63820 RepID=A0A9W9TS32_9EURO|nr:uncharacterized protein N7468_003939 [Penicillium chermesinum]KAJ5239320.1 hypothetical protein N7468_003939 [Penicillium chermesinum]